MDVTSEPLLAVDLLEYLRSLDSWDVVIDTMGRIKKARKVVELSNEKTYSLGGVSGKARLMRVFREKVCRYNRERRIDENIRSVFTGHIVEPGTPMYSRTLRLCGLRRYFSTCREIVGRQSFVHPISGKRVMATSSTGKKLIRRCRI